MGKKEELVWKYLVQNPTADAEEVARETQVSYMHVKKCMNKIGTPKEVLASMEPSSQRVSQSANKWGCTKKTYGRCVKTPPEKEEEFEIEELFKDVDDEWIDKAPSYHRQDVLLKAGNLIDGDRHEEYGEAKDNFALIAKYWNGHLGLVDFITVRDVAIMMTLMKIARTHGDGRKSRDTFVDICGYAALAGEINEDG